MRDCGSHLCPICKPPPPKKARVWPLLLAVLALWLTALFSVGCAAPAKYSVALHAMGPSDFLNDGPEMVFTLHNNDDQTARLTMTCAEVGTQWVVDVPAHGRVSALGQLLGKQTHANPCTVEGEVIHASR